MTLVGLFYLLSTAVALFFMVLLGLGTYCRMSNKTELFVMRYMMLWVLFMFVSLIICVFFNDAVRGFLNAP